MFTDLALGALGHPHDLPTALELAARHGFGGVDPDVGHLRGLSSRAQVQELADDLTSRGLRWGIGGLPVSLTAPPAVFAEQLAALPQVAEVLVAAGVGAVGTWVKPMDDALTYRRNWRLHVGRLALVAGVLDDAGIRLGLEYVGPKTFWSTERFPFVHTLAELRELIADAGAGNVGVILDTYHWYTAGETAADLRALTASDIISVDLNDARDDLERDEQQDQDRRLPGTTGVIDLSGFVDVLVELGYDGPVKAEPFLSSLADRPVDDVLAEVSDLLHRALAPAQQPSSSWMEDSPTG
jgi:sugar phosphate isomerase/epimerase